MINFYILEVFKSLVDKYLEDLISSLRRLYSIYSSPPRQDFFFILQLRIIFYQYFLLSCCCFKKKNLKKREFITFQWIMICYLLAG